VTSKQIAAALEDALNDAAAATQAVRGQTPQVTEGEARLWLVTAMANIDALWEEYLKQWKLEELGASPS
jgi:hypothetical protein